MPNAMTEQQLLDSVLELCHLLGLRTMHQRPARTQQGWRTAVSGDGKGWPDLVIVGHKMIIRELKSSRGRLTAEQQAWITHLSAAGVDVDVWRPSDWHDLTIRTTLSQLAEHRGTRIVA